jgi:TonB family protein
MRTLVGILTFTLLAVLSYAQPANLRYGISVSIKFQADGDYIPVERKITPPAYPAELRPARISGGAAFKFSVQPDGKVTDISVTALNKNEIAEIKAAVKEALATWQFEPTKPGPHAPKAPVLITGEIQFDFLPE